MTHPREVRGTLAFTFPHLAGKQLINAEPLVATFVVAQIHSPTNLL